MFTRLFRFLSRKKTPKIDDGPFMAAALASYFGTEQDRPPKGDPRLRGHAVLQFLVSVPGSAAMVLRDRAEAAIRAGTFPKKLSPGTLEYREVARAIYEVCRHFAER